MPILVGLLARLADPFLQGLQLLGVFMAGLVVGDDGGGNGRERKSFGGRISIAGGLGQLTGGGSVVQADKATVDSASSIGLSGNINGYPLNEGVALFSDDLDAVDVLGDDLDGGFGLLLCGCSGVPLGLNVTRALEPAEAEQSDAKRRQGPSSRYGHGITLMAPPRCTAGIRRLAVWLARRIAGHWWVARSPCPGRSASAAALGRHPGSPGC